MADTLTFGPEWLRALSDGNSVTSPPPSPAGMPKYKLAEHRYGREEMLALYVPKSEVPADLKDIQAICIDKTLRPLVFSPPTEDEQRLLSGTVNSAGVLNKMGRGRSEPRGGGRGGGDRGRGRGRGRGDGGPFYQGRASFEEGEYGRGRSLGGNREGWDDGEHGRRGGFERGGGFRQQREPEFEEQPPSRRDFSRSMSSDNWRESRKEEGGDDGDWRRAGGHKERWGGRGSWRDHHAERGGGGRYDYHDRGNRGFEDYRSYDRGYHRTKSGSWEDEEELPEWSTADADEDIGTFDSSGAFMSISEAQEKEKEDSRSDGRQPEIRGKNEGRKSGSKEKEPARKQAEKSKSPSVEKSSKSSSAEKENIPANKPGKAKTPPESAASKADSQNKDSTTGGAGSKAGKKGAKSGGSASPQVKDSSPPSKQDASKPSAKDSGQTKEAPGKGGKGVNSSDSVNSVNKNPKPTSDKGRGAASVEAPKKEQKPQQPATSAAAQKAPLAAAAISANQGAIEKLKEQKQQPPPDAKMAEVEANFEHIEKAVGNLMDTLDDDEPEKEATEEPQIPQVPSQLKGEAVPVNHENAYKWFYRDPQGELQGPFQAAEMTDWFGAGYFTMNLLVKRGCDELFSPLGELIKKWAMVPFVQQPSKQPPPLKNVPSGGAGGVNLASLLASTAQQSAQVAASLPIAAAAGTPLQDPVQEQIRQMHAQMLIQQQMQQQALARQYQMNQVLTSLQQQEEFSKLPPSQQHAVALQLILKQQAQQPLPTAGATSTATTAMLAAAVAQQSQAAAAAVAAAQQQQKLSPRSDGLHRSMSVTPPELPHHQASHAPSFHRSMSQPGGAPQAEPDAPGPMPWQQGGNVPTTSGAWTAGSSVWDIEPTKAQTVADIEEQQQREIERTLREKADRDAEAIKAAEEHRRKVEAEDRARKEKMEKEKREAEERERERERLEAERQAQLEKEMQEELERKRLADVERQKQEQARIDAEKKRRAAEEEQRKREEEERIRQEQIAAQQEEERRRREQEEIERKRQDEIRRRQEKADEHRRQQEALRRIQEAQQLANMKLPQHANWASNNGGQQNNSTLSLQEIQALEAERAKEEEERQRKILDQQRQQLAALHQQQQKAQLTWAQQARVGVNSAPAAASGNGGKSLVEIQQEQAKQHLEDLHRKQQQASKQAQGAPAQVEDIESPTAPSQQEASMSLGSAAVWGNASASHWAQEGAWGNPTTRQNLGFWEETPTSQPSTNKNSNKKQASNANNSHFPALGGDTNGRSKASNASSRKGQSKSKKEEETVQRLFQSMTPKDDFTQWCEEALSGMSGSVDVPTFVAFLKDVDSPYEVHDYVRSYLGESKQATKFAQDFIDKRSKFKNQQMRQQQEEDMWGPAKAIMPGQQQQQQSNKQHNNNSSTAINEEMRRADKSSKKKKNKMQKLDGSMLGFSCTADSGRVNIGEIETVDKA